jgi:hypothetical protein
MFVELQINATDIAHLVIYMEHYYVMIHDFSIHLVNKANMTKIRPTTFYMFFYDSVHTRYI